MPHAELAFVDEKLSAKIEIWTKIREAHKTQDKPWEMIMVANRTNRG